MTGRLSLDREAGWAVDGSDGATGPDAAFDRYVAEHQLALVRYATLLSGSQQLAEDLVQDVLVRLYPRWGTLTDPHPYVRRCVTNEFLSWRRRWSTRHIHAVPDVVLEGIVDDTADPAGRADGRPDPALWGRLMALPRQQRAAVVLRYWEGLDDVEIGELLDCRPATVRSHVSRGLAALRAALSTDSCPAPHDEESTP